MKEFDESQNLKPDEKVYRIDVQLIGLPISNKGGVTIAAVIILFVMLQIKLVGTFWSQGTLAFLAIISFIGFRVWFLKREYPSDLGCVKIDSSKIIFPKCLNKNIEEIVAEKNDIQEIMVYTMPKKDGEEQLTSARFVLKYQTVIVVNYLSLDMEKLLRYLDKKGYIYIKSESIIYSRAKYWFIIVLIIFIVVVPLYLHSILH